MWTWGLCQEPGESSKEAKNRDIGREKNLRDKVLLNLGDTGTLRLQGFLFVCLGSPPPTVDGSDSGNGGYDDGQSVKTMNLERNGGWETERKGSFFQTTFSW